MATKPESNGPSLLEITLGACLSLLLGAVIAAGYLAVQPVQSVRSMPAEPEKGVVYYVTGSESGAARAQSMRKRQLLVEGGATEIRLSEQELNAWIASSQANPDGEDDESGILKVDSVNFRVADDALQIGLPCTFSLLGLNRSIIVQARGGFEKSGDRFVFAPDSLMIGGLAAHRLPVVADIVMGQVLSGQEFPEELQSAWGALSEVSVEGNELVLVRR